MDKKYLNLTLSKVPFSVMITGEKDIEIREDKQWVRSRLLTPNGIRKKYDFIKFTNGYGANRPYFIVEYKGFYFIKEDMLFKYKGGVQFKAHKGDIIIELGKIIEIGNHKTT